MEKYATALVRRTKLNKIFRQLKAGAFPKNRLEKIMCELTIIDNQITLNLPWAQFSLEAKTIGTAKATFPFLNICNVLKTFIPLNITIRVEEKGWIKFETFAINSNTCFFEDDKILRSIVLPINNNEMDLLHLLDGRYSKEELEFNKLWVQAASAARRMNSAIDTAFWKLKPYGVSHDELEKLVKGKVGKLEMIE